MSHCVAFMVAVFTMYSVMLYGPETAYRTSVNHQMEGIFERLPFPKAVHFDGNASEPVCL